MMKTMSDILLFLVGVLALLGIFVLFRQRLKGIGIGGAILMLQKFKVDDAAPDGVCIEIEGRGKGIIAWLMTLVGLEPRGAMRVTASECHFEWTTMFGQLHQVIPLPSISMTCGGFAKPVVPLIVALLFGLGVLAGPIMLLQPGISFGT